MRELTTLALLLVLTCPCTTWGAQAIETQLKRVVTETRKNLPMMLSEDIQATNIGASGRTLINYYNFTRQKSEFYNLPGIVDNYRRNSIDAACTNPGTRSFIDHNKGSIQYQFFDSKNVFVAKFTINAKTCRAR